MTDRKFTPPAEFPAEYVTRDGHKAVILGRMPNETFPFAGYIKSKSDPNDCAETDSWTEGGSAYVNRESSCDLHDLPKKRVNWANDYASAGLSMLYGRWYGSRHQADRAAESHRIAVIRREWVEGQPPQYFTEEL